MLRPSTHALILLLLGCLAACDNVGRAFGPAGGGNNGGGGGTTTLSPVQVVPLGGDARSGVPRVVAANPKGGGWPATVPIVVEFSESVNESYLRPTSATATDGRLFVRVKGTTTALPAAYDFLAGGRLAVIRPTTLPNQSQPFEVVLSPDGRDCDGVRFSASKEQILAEFTADAASTDVNGKIVATYPRSNARDATRETDMLVFFTRPANAATLTSSSFRLRQAGGADVTCTIATPLSVAGVADPRLARLRPRSTLAAGTQYELVVDATITFGSSGVLDFGRRTPFLNFTTIQPREPLAVSVSNFTPGFPDKINRTNLQGLVLDVQLAADAVAGDLVVARVYGLDRQTAATNDLAFVERSALAPVGGAQHVTVDFGTALGTVDTPRLGEGSVTLLAQLQRGDGHSGFMRGDSANNPLLDTTLPTLVHVGPPGQTGTNDVYTDVQHLAFYGQASEELGAASLVVLSQTVELFGSDSTGHFLLKPADLGRLQAPVSYSLTLTDAAGNMVAAPITGNVHQRGVVTGTQAGALVVEAYDDTTLLPVANATVLVDPGVPVVPASGQLVATTDANGQASFASLATPTVTVTVVRAGYQLRTLYGTGAAFVSLPLRPVTNATATLRGSVVLQQAPNTTTLVGNNVFDDDWRLDAATTSSAPLTIPDTAIVPNRPQVLTAFAGTFEPTATPTFTNQGFLLLGPTLVAPSAPGTPGTPGQAVSVSLTLVTATGATANLASTYSKDLAAVTGLDASNLVGGKPVVRATMELLGFPGQTLAGVGYATSNGGTSWSIQGSYAQAPIAGLASFTPTFWMLTEARDTSGGAARHRVLVIASNGTYVDGPLPGLPTITAPGGPFPTAPLVQFADTVDRTAVPLGLGLVEVVATDLDGRQWSVLAEDTDGTGTDTVQFPDLATNGVTGLRVGNWTVRTQSRLFLSTTQTPGDLLLTEARRGEITLARAPTVTFVVQ